MKKKIFARIMIFVLLFVPLTVSAAQDDYTLVVEKSTNEGFLLKDAEHIVSMGAVSPDSSMMTDSKQYIVYDKTGLDEHPMVYDIERNSYHQIPAALGDDFFVNSDHVGNEGAVYTWYSEGLYRYYFKTNQAVKIASSVAAYKKDKNSIALVYANEGKIFRMAKDSEETKVIGEYNKKANIRLLSMMDSENIVIYSEQKNNLVTFHMIEGMNTKKIGSYKTNDTMRMNTHVFYDKNAKKLMILNGMQVFTYNAITNKTMIGTLPAEVIDPFNLSLYESLYYTSTGAYDEDTNYDLSSFYIYTNERLYFIDQNSNIKVVTPNKIYNPKINGSCIVYSNRNGKLYKSKLNGSGLEETTVVAKDNYAFFQPTNKGELFYATNNGNLYYVDANNKTSRIAQLGTLAEAYSFEVSDDGSTIIYYTNTVYTSGDDTARYYEYGTLYAYTAGKKSVKITEKALTTASIVDIGANKNSVVFAEYHKKEQKHYVDYKYFDGTNIIDIKTDHLLK